MCRAVPVDVSHATAYQVKMSSEHRIAVLPIVSVKFTLPLNFPLLGLSCFKGDSSASAMCLGVPIAVIGSQAHPTKLPGELHADRC